MQVASIHRHHHVTDGSCSLFILSQWEKKWEEASLEGGRLGDFTQLEQKCDASCELSHGKLGLKT